MIRINLRDYYPHYRTDCFIEVDEAVAEVLKELDRKEASYQRYVRRYKAYYSLDVDNGIHKSILLAVAVPEEIYEQKWMAEELYKAIDTLPRKQAARICAHYLLDLSKSEIARIEGIHESSVRESIRRGLESLADILDKTIQDFFK